MKIVLSFILLSLCFGQDWTDDVTLPNKSQKATVSQYIGLTDIRVEYHRPYVKNRKIWGELVPYNKIWRAGANDNTVISFTHEVQIAGKKVPAGTYGLHLIPSEKDWALILSSNYTSWGSYFYKEEEDVLRVSLKTETAPHSELLTFTFDRMTDHSATLALIWEKRRVNIPISVDVKHVVFTNLKNELRSVAAFSWQGWHEAANYLAENNYELDYALGWIEESIKREKNFQNLATKAHILNLKNKKADAKKLINEALSAAPEKAKPYLKKKYKQLF